MKRIKMMLLSLALFAVVGGALAFKAKFDQNFCVTATTQQCPLDRPALACPILTIGVSTTDQGEIQYCTTPLPAGKTNCQNVLCTTEPSTFTKVDQ